MANSSGDKLNLDSLLSQVKSNYQSQHEKGKQTLKSHRELSHNSSNDLLESIKSEFKQKKDSVTVDFEINKQKNRNQNIFADSEKILENIKKNRQIQKETEDQQLKQHNQEEIRYAEQRRQQQKKLLTRKAQQWLADLDIYSEEGLWFEEFARTYPSKLEAALDYLAIVENTG
ncbi:salt stress protein, Slr1339 family [Aphanothece sacrum]|nr:hypothetical protein [Aphanothece sacrum]GBF85708.1 hypothetical protein AsFPU3_2773 [Aphanothece sacrum FPU3]